MKWSDYVNFRNHVQYFNITDEEQQELVKYVKTKGWRALLNSSNPINWECLYTLSNRYETCYVGEAYFKRNKVLPTDIIHDLSSDGENLAMDFWRAIRDQDLELAKEIANQIDKRKWWK